MQVPRFWTRAIEGERVALGWSDTSAADAERVARERLTRLRGGPLDPDWDYYPSTPVREEILERPGVAGLQVLVTRNRAGARVLNVDRAAFVDIDLPVPRRSLLGALLGRKRDDGPAVEEALDRARSWAEANRARLRAYRTTRGLRLLRLDALVDPTGEACQAMFEALDADPQYRQLCRVQASFRARLSPKPRRVGVPAAPGVHPREGSQVAAFQRWLLGYEAACRGHTACRLLEDLGAGAPLASLRALADLHDRQAVGPGELA